MSPCDGFDNTDHTRWFVHFQYKAALSFSQCFFVLVLSDEVLYDAFTESAVEGPSPYTSETTRISLLSPQGGGSFLLPLSR